MNPISRRRGYVRQEVTIPGAGEHGCTWRGVSDAMFLIRQEAVKVFDSSSPSSASRLEADDLVKVEVNEDGDLVFWFEYSVADSNPNKVSISDPEVSIPTPPESTPPIMAAR